MESAAAQCDAERRNGVETTYGSVAPPLAVPCARWHVRERTRMNSDTHVEVVMHRSISSRARLRFAFALSALAPLAPAFAQSTGNIEGAVTATAGGRPLSDVQVTVVGTTLGARTDEQGHYRIGAVPAGAHQVRAQRIGYAAVTRPLTITAGQTETLNFSIAEAALSLD